MGGDPRGGLRRRSRAQILTPPRRRAGSRSRTALCHVGFYQENRTIVFPYNYDGHEYVCPDFHTYGENSLATYILTRKRPYRFADDGGELVSRGVAYGDESRVSALSNMGIADRLQITELTVKTHVSRILAKFGVRQRSAVAAKLRPLR